MFQKYLPLILFFGSIAVVYLCILWTNYTYKRSLRIKTLCPHCLGIVTIQFKPFYLSGYEVDFLHKYEGTCPNCKKTVEKKSL